MIALILGLSTANAGQVINFSTQVHRTFTHHEHVDVDATEMYNQLDAMAVRLESIERIAIEVRETHLRRALFEELRALNTEMIRMERLIEAAENQPGGPPPVVVPAEPPPPVWDPGQCESRLQPMYAESYPAARALDEAREDCRQPFDIPTFEFVVNAYKESYPSFRAVDEAVPHARDRSVAQRLPVVQWAFAAYNESYPSFRAVDVAIEKTNGLSLDHMACLERSYPIYNQTYPSFRAVDKSIESCR